MTDQPPIHQPSTESRKQQARRYAGRAAQVYVYMLIPLMLGMVVMVYLGNMESVFHQALWYGYAQPFVYFGAAVRWLFAPLINGVQLLGNTSVVVWYLVGVPAVIIGLLIAILRKR